MVKVSGLNRQLKTWYQVYFQKWPLFATIQLPIKTNFTKATQWRRSIYKTIYEGFAKSYPWSLHGIPILFFSNKKLFLDLKTFQRNGCFFPGCFPLRMIKPNLLCDKRRELWRLYFLEGGFRLLIHLKWKKKIFEILNCFSKKGLVIKTTLKWFSASWDQHVRQKAILRLWQ